MGLTCGALGPLKGADSGSEGRLGDSAFPWGHQCPGHISAGAEAPASGASGTSSRNPGSLTDVVWGDKGRGGDDAPGSELWSGAAAGRRSGPAGESRQWNLGVMDPNSGELVHWTQ